MSKRTIPAILIILVSLATSSCRRDPLDGLQDQLREYPRYSIVLEDMDREGNFFTDYYHKYKLVWQEPGEDGQLRSRETDWERVDKSTFRRYEDCLGMALRSKGGQGDVSQDCYPAGFQYLGDRRYGRWRTDSRGNTFWEFAGKYAVARAIFNWGDRNIGRGEWDSYRTARQNSRPYFGNGTYGTSGTHTRKMRPNFFQRRQAREAARKASFGQKVRSRAGRSRSSGARSRGFSSGK
ncbi:MAG TPA: hypothetical protein VLU25_02660 [Acidobacteriota bacterium]|nr:hypothetical protein [Acidobacteriota bacterium]